MPLGLLWRGRTLYVSESGRVDAFGANGRRLRVVLSNLPYKLHQQDSIVAGADGRLYLGSGSTCDACSERDPRSAAILSFRPDGSGLRIVATGLRNPYGLTFVGRTLYATVNGRDKLGDGEPAEEVVNVRQGGRYGWPELLAELRAEAADGLVRRGQRRRSPTSSRTRRPTGSSPGAAISSWPSGASTCRRSTAASWCGSGGAASRRSPPASPTRSRSRSIPPASCWSPTGSEA